MAATRVKLPSLSDRRGPTAPLIPLDSTNSFWGWYRSVALEVLNAGQQSPYLLLCGRSPFAPPTLIEGAPSNAGGTRHWHDGLRPVSSG
jgi:hypothetical protein